MRPRLPDLSLLLTHGMPHAAIGRHDRHVRLDVRAAGRPSDIPPIHQHVAGAAIGSRGGFDVNDGLLCDTGHSGLIVNIDAALQDQPGNGAIHNAGIEEQIAERFRQPTPKRGLAGGGRTVNRNDRGACNFVFSKYDLTTDPTRGRCEQR